MDNDIDFDFFEDGSAANEDKSHQLTNSVKKSDDKVFESKPSSNSSSSSSNSNYESSDDDSHNNLHGVNGDKSNTADEIENELKNINSLSSSTDHLYSDTDSRNGLTTDDDGDGRDYTKQKDFQKSKSKRPSRKTASRHKNSTQSSDSGDSSASVTDVSPLTSPDRSPVLQRHSSTSKLLDDNHSNTSNHIPVKHITKLNVTFKSQEKRKYNKTETESLHADSSYQPVTFKHVNEGGDYPSDVKHQNNECYSSHKRNAKSSEIRQGLAAINHRQRLLDSAARGSMDVSSLLETVLEFEKQNFDRMANNRQELPMNYRIGERMLNDQERKQRKNMSFSNDRVRDIDRENKRLLGEITRRSRPSSASSVRSTASIGSNVSRCSRVSNSSRCSTKKQQSEKPVKLYHTAINRIQYQRRIERENMQLLKRLQSAKPTPGIQRQRQLAEYKQKSGYMGASIDRSGMSLHRAIELTRDAEVVQDAMGLHKTKKRPVKPAWQDSW